MTTATRDLARVRRAMLAGAALWVTIGAAAGETAAAQAAKPVDEFRVGDVVVLEVTGVKAFSDTFQVRDGLVLEIPSLPAISLAGVRRGEVQQHLAKELAKYVVNPDVRAHSLINLGVVGAVETPGFYAVRSDAPLADVLMRAGGLTRDANPDRVLVRRNGKKLLDEKHVRMALATGLTVDRLALDGGDQLVVSERRKIAWGDVLRNSAYVVGLAASLYAGRTLF